MKFLSIQSHARYAKTGHIQSGRKSVFRTDVVLLPRHGHTEVIQATCFRGSDLVTTWPDYFRIADNTPCDGLTKTA